MANDYIIRALRANAKSLNLSSKKISALSNDLAKLPQVSELRLNSNRLTSLPLGVRCMRQLTELNIGNNALEEVPPVLKNLPGLKRLHLFRNKICTLPAEVLEGLSHLTVLNLNHNNIRVIPPAIKRFSIADNRLEEIPAELGLLVGLAEMNLSRNNLSAIPQEMYKLTHLRKLSLARNSLRELPEGIHGWRSLKMFDVAANRLLMFPADFHFLKLEELYFEGNDLVRFQALTPAKDQEVLPLKELTARLILKEHLNKSSALTEALRLLPELQTMLSRFGRCAVCLEPFLTTLVECVQFISLCKDMRIKNSQNIPVRVRLCSYSCLNKSPHPYYSVAKVKL